MDIGELEKDYKFKFNEKDKGEGIYFIEFKDGRKYKFQMPGFFEIHDAMDDEKM